MSYRKLHCTMATSQKSQKTPSPMVDFSNSFLYNIEYCLTMITGFKFHRTCLRMAKRESGVNPEQSCCCIRAVVSYIHCFFSEKGDSALLRESEYLLRTAAINYTQ